RLNERFRLRACCRCRPSAVTLCVKGLPKRCKGPLGTETRSMADEERNSGGAGEPPHRRRMPPPTIDLEATHVSTPSESAAAESAAAQPDQAPSEPETAAVEGDPAPVEPAASAPTGEPAEKPSAASDRPRGTSLTWSLAAAGALGAVLGP